jgi:hypothetical protein
MPDEDVSLLGQEMMRRQLLFANDFLDARFIKLGVAFVAVLSKIIFIETKVAAEQ